MLGFYYRTGMLWQLLGSVIGLDYCKMINLGPSWGDVHWPDNWTATTVDGRRSAQFEETLLYVFGSVIISIVHSISQNYGNGGGSIDGKDKIAFVHHYIEILQLAVRMHYTHRRDGLSQPLANHGRAIYIFSS